MRRSPQKIPDAKTSFGARSLGCVGGRRNLSGVANRMNCELDAACPCHVPENLELRYWTVCIGPQGGANSWTHGRPSAFARRSRVHPGPPQAVVIRIAITAAAFEAAAASLPFGSVGFESAPRASA